MRYCKLFLLLLGPVFLISATLNAASAEKIPVEAFGRQPEFAGIEISPDGTKFAALLEVEGRDVVVVYAIPKTTNKPLTGVPMPEKAQARWVKWANNNVVLVSIRFPAQRYGTPTTETRLLRLPLDGSKVITLNKTKKRSKTETHRYQPQFQDQILDIIPNDPDHILLEWNEEFDNIIPVYRVDVNTGRFARRQSGRRNVTNWITDRDGNIRAATKVDEFDKSVIARLSGGSTLEAVWAGATLGSEKFHPVGFGADPDIMLVLANNGSDRLGLWEFDLRTQNFGKLIFSHAKADIHGVLYDSDGTTVIAASYALAGNKTHYVDGEYALIKKEIKQAFPGQSTGITSVSRNRKKVIVSASGNSEPSLYYVYDRDKRSIDPLAASYPELYGKQLSAMESTSYKARDGLTIPAFVSLPPGQKGKKPIPFIVMPHGGPHARDKISFDFVTQFLTNRGYGVLQMNFRGSSGYGAKFEEAGDGQRGLAMQDDVTDGAKWLIDQGLTSPGNLCIVGWSYGGYAALMGAVKTPDLFNCAASMAGVSDTGKLKRDQRGYINLRVRTSTLGSDSVSNKEVSPLARVNEIKIPILLLHGEVDRVVRVSHSRDMASALKRAKKSYKYVELENGNHSLTSGINRTQFLKELESFLAEHLN